MAGLAIENVDASVLRDLRDDVDAASLAANGDQRGRRGKIAIPHVVPDGLKVPDTLAVCGAQAQDRIGKQVVAAAVRAVEIVRGRTGRGVDEAAALVERD